MANVLSEETRQVYMNLECNPKMQGTRTRKAVYQNMQVTSIHAEQNSIYMGSLKH